MAQAKTSTRPDTGVVSRVLNTSTGFRGEVISHDLIELVQLVAMTMPTGALHLSAPQGAGTLWLEQGMIVHAVAGDSEGTDAFQRMLLWNYGRFSVVPREPAPERTISSTTTQLLLESACILDEAHAHEAKDEHSSVQEAVETAAEHFERGLTAVHHKRYGEALAEWECAALLDQDNRVYQHNLKRIRQLIDASQRDKPRGGVL